MTRSFTLDTVTTQSREALFDISLDIDAHAASMAHSREVPIAGVTSGSIGLNESVTWKARHFGIWFTLQTEIVELERPHRFVDVQVSGPFAHFRHEHVFELRGGRTRMRDIVTIGAPVLGWPVDRMILVPYMRRLIARRNAHLLHALDARGTA